VDLADEEHVTLLEVREDRGEIPGTLQRRAGRRTEPHAHRVRHDACERGLAEPWWAGEQQMIHDVPSSARPLDQEPELFPDPLLSHEFGERLRAERKVEFD